MVGLGHTDDWGTGGTEEANYRQYGEEDDGMPPPAGAMAAGDWDDECDVEFLSTFGLAEGDDSSDGDRGGAVGAWGGGGGVEGAAVASPLSERDAARLEEVGIMVRELEAGTGGCGTASAARGGTAAAVGRGGAGGVAPAAPQQPPSRERGDDDDDDDGGGGWGGGPVDEKATAAEMREDFADGVETGSARLRMTCGDPVFFGQLAELMQGLQRRSGGRKFLTHEEEMALGVKVQRYRRLIEVRREEEKRSGLFWGGGGGGFSV